MVTQCEPLTMAILLAGFQAIEQQPVEPSRLLMSSFAHWGLYWYMVIEGTYKGTGFVLEWEGNMLDNYKNEAVTELDKAALPNMSEFDFGTRFGKFLWV